MTDLFISIESHSTLADFPIVAEWAQSHETILRALGDWREGAKQLADDATIRIAKTGHGTVRVYNPYGDEHPEVFPERVRVLHYIA